MSRPHHELYIKDLGIAFFLYREAIKHAVEPVLKKKKNTSEKDRDEMIEKISGVINKESMDKLRDMGVIGSFQKAGESILKKYLGIKKDGSYDEGGRIIQLKNIYDYSNKGPSKRKQIQDIVWTAKIRVLTKNRDENKILMFDGGPLDRFADEKTLEKLIHEKPELYLPFSELTRTERDNPFQELEILSFANSAKYYADDPNQEVIKSESRLKASESFRTKLLESYFFQFDDSLALLPNDFLGDKLVAPLWMLHQATASLLSITRNGKHIIDAVKPEYEGIMMQPSRKRKQGEDLIYKKHLKILSDYKKLENLTEEASRLNRKYERMTDSQIQRTSKEKLKSDAQKMLLSNKLLIETTEGLPIREMQLTPEWEFLYEEGKLTSHDKVYYFQRRENIQKQREKQGIPKVINYVEDQLKYLFRIQN